MTGSRLISRDEILRHCPPWISRERVPVGLKILVTDERHVKALIHEALSDLNLGKPWWKRRKPVPLKPGQERLHTVEMAYRRLQSSRPAAAVKTIDAIWPIELSDTGKTPTSEILEYLNQKRRPSVEYLGHIYFEPTGEEPYRMKIVTRWIPRASSLDELDEETLNKKRKSILRQLAEHFAYFHGEWEKKMTESEIKQKRERQYIRVGDCRSANFVIDKNGVVHVLDPETWEITDHHPALTDQHYDLKNFLRQLRKDGVIKTEEDVDEFLYWYTGRFRPERKYDPYFKERQKILAQMLKRTVFEDVFKEIP